MALTSMKREKKKADHDMVMPDERVYPYGLQINLEDEDLEKLGVDSLPKVGSVLRVLAKVEVTSISENESKEGGTRRSVSLQITEMGLGAESAADRMYPKKKG